LDKTFDAVVFDYGGVMITSITNKFIPLAERAETSVEVIREIVMGPLGVSTNHPWHRAERGEIALGQIQKELEPYADKYSVNLYGDEIETVYSNTKSGLTTPYTIIEPMVQKAIEVQKRGFSIALLTNLFTEFYPTVKKELEEVKFDAWVASSEEGTRKPEAKIYEITEELLQISGEKILFLDDFEPNLIAAEKAGWSVIKVTNPLDAIKELDDKLLLPF
jgi:epoxide hydrolase-like predicted phosphatase|tara:strand:+ start:1046 stop:1705 length:660 start_codon:yes stop_codon:yes gene_type:complete